MTPALREVDPYELEIRNVLNGTITGTGTGESNTTMVQLHAYWENFRELTRNLWNESGNHDARCINLVIKLALRYRGAIRESFREPYDQKTTIRAYLLNELREALSIERDMDTLAKHSLSITTLLAMTVVFERQGHL